MAYVVGLMFMLLAGTFLRVWNRLACAAMFRHN